MLSDIYVFRILNTAIGGYDGHVYESLYENALRNPLNKQEPFLGYEYPFLLFLTFSSLSSSPLPILRMIVYFCKISEASFGS